MIVSPLLLELGVHPLVAASTSSLMVRPLQLKFGAIGYLKCALPGRRIHLQPHVEVFRLTALKGVVQDHSATGCSAAADAGCHLQPDCALFTPESYSVRFVD